MTIMPHIFLIDDEENVVSSLSTALRNEGFGVDGFISPGKALAAMKNKPADIVITDIIMPEINGIELIEKMKKIQPELKFIIMTAHASVDTAVQALRLGAIDYLIKPFRIKELVTVIEKALSQTRFVPGTEAQHVIQSRYRFKNLLSEDGRMKEIFSMISKISKTSSTVLIMGESGTGKEMIARSIHFNSPRKDRAFVSVNCAALPETLLESELFGYEKGAFTGAQATKQGLLEVANNGTFFLDEVGEIPISLQAKLLRVLQERVVKHVGGIKDIPIDIRLIAATSKNLPKEMEEGRFREDLFYRLHVVPIILPPLRERKVDIPLFIEYFLHYHCQKYHIDKIFRIDEDAMKLLQNYAWPGNIRELENLTERIVTTEEGKTVTVSMLENLIGKDSLCFVSKESKIDTGKLNIALEHLEKQMIVSAIEKARGNKFKAARELGLTRQNLRYKLKKYGI